MLSLVKMMVSKLRDNSTSFLAKVYHLYMHKLTAKPFREFKSLTLTISMSTHSESLSIPRGFRSLYLTSTGWDRHP